MLKVLGFEIDPTTPQDLYTAAAGPPGKQAAVVVNVLNRTGAPLTVDIWLVPSGDAVGDDVKVKSYSLGANDDDEFGFAVGPGDGVYVQGSAVGLTFVAHGDETDAQ